MGTTAREPVRQSQEDDEPDKRAKSNWEPKLLLLLLQRCRICAGSAGPAAARTDEQEDHGPPTRIFADEPASASLRGNIHKYLHIAVSSEDKLPKVVCASCVNKLEDIHAFATMALKSQERLKQELLRTTGDSVVAIDSSDSSDSTTNKLEDRGLLHSILTKGSLDTSNDGESVAGRQRTPSTEEMEVKVDPMLFLQCALDQPSSADYSDYSDDSVREVDSYSGPRPGSTSLPDGQDKSAIGKVRSRCRDSNDNESPLAKRMASDDYEQDYDFEEEELDEEEEEEEEEDERAAETDRRSSHACKLCGRSFGSQLGLQNHLWSHLPTTTRSDSAAAKDTAGTTSAGACLDGNGLLAAASYICPICGKRISTKGNLKVHLETHRPKGKYGCDICGRIFKTQSNLFRHKEYHSSVQFPCAVCGRVYPTNSTLRAHSITHSDLRPHACPLCDKTFKRNQDLKFHINQHTGARPYQCPYCPKAFASSGNCFSHRKRMHPKEVHRDRQRAADLMR